MINLSKSSRECIRRLGLISKRARVFGTDYLHLELPGKGDLYVTSWGLPVLENLVPENWSDEEYYSRPENRDLRMDLEGWRSSDLGNALRFTALRLEDKNAARLDASILAADALRAGPARLRRLPVRP